MRHYRNADYYCFTRFIYLRGVDESALFNVLTTVDIKQLCVVEEIMCLLLKCSEKSEIK